MAATLSRMMKKAAASSLIPLANRTTHHRNYTSAIRSINSTTNRHLSAVAEKKSNSVDILLRDLESEKNYHDEKFRKVLEASKEFPFKIDDTNRYSLKLTREYHGEEIQVTIQEPFNSKKKQGDPQYFDLNVSVSKKSGPTLNFYATADVDGTMAIEVLEVKNPNPSDDIGSYDRPDFPDLDANMQKAFYRFLEVRGIEPKISKFLCDYMVQRKRKTYSAWFKNLKNFLAS